MKLFGNPFSTCTRKVMLTLNEKNTPFEFLKIDLVQGEHKQPAYLDKQPFGVVPFLDDKGFHIYESRAIIRYLDRRLSGVSLTPHDEHQFGRMEQWMSVEQSYFATPAVQIAKELVRAPMLGNQPNMDIVEQARPKVEHALNVADKHLTKNAYFAGEHFSLADITWMPYVDYLFAAKLDNLINDRDSMKAWWERVSHRPTWAKVKSFK